MRGLSRAGGLRQCRSIRDNVYLFVLLFYFFTFLLLRGWGLMGIDDFLEGVNEFADEERLSFDLIELVWDESVDAYA